MKVLRFLEKLYQAQIRQFENPSMFDESPKIEGIVVGLKMALSEVQEEITKMQDK